MFCRFCGVKLPDEAVFCPECGGRVAVPAQPAAPASPQPAQPAAPTYPQPTAPTYTQPAAPTYTQPAAPTYPQPAAPVYTQPTAPVYSQPAAPVYAQPVQPAAPVSTPPRVRVGVQPGFSDKINDPAIRAALKKGKRFTFLFALVLVLAPLVVTFVLSMKDGNFENVKFGAILSLIFLAFSVFPSLKKGAERQWDGVVTDKRIDYRKEVDRNSNSTTTHVRKVYITRFRRDNGGTKTLQESEINHVFYDYLQVGDRVRYYPQFNCYYEKYDKSNDTCVICPMCNTLNDLANDTCSRCGVPVIK